jgi:glycosyltransferase involved in cell wall biosynthesis
LGAQDVEITETILKLQAMHSTARRAPTLEDRIGFFLSSRDRYGYTLRTIQSLDNEGGFDLIWNDGSVEGGVPALARNYKFQKARLVEVNRGVTGGPDAAIEFGLKRLLELGYDYIGMIENDILFQPGWFSRLLELFRLGTQEGFAVGSATVRSYESHTLEYRDGYCLCLNTGAGMALLSRGAAEILVELYARPNALRMSTADFQEFYADVFKIQLRYPMWNDHPRDAEIFCGLDWGYTPALYWNGYASLNSMPTYATDLEFDVEQTLKTRYVIEDKKNAGPEYERLKAANGASEHSRWDRLLAGKRER